ncbi:flagellar hook protein FlgE [Paracoccus saliphilus]|uniref:Flagellar hook protein FlgE n=1 Tax=Paracoccus saliphilus TaxID=405559 RepID=A0AA45W6P3_9RHOB|nr:flagellar hook-basal body complex protein [Paracoccus saliphilus]WCR02866.1 flagellar hook-basal body complex protein [Paracoccus saliphilus]SIT03564.1 flagellar hook protein FlgE [Paracoccus saliphilus]
MSMTSAMGAGVAGLMANSTRLASISDNIANTGTHGYKRVATEFDSLVLNQSGGGTYSAGGVRASSKREIDQTGTLISTSNSMDIAIAGAGMLPVTSINDVTGGSSQLPMLMTRTGGFNPDANGFLRTDSGLVLMGWPASKEGTVPTFSRDTMKGLEPVRIAGDRTVSDPTTQIKLGITLPASETLPTASGDPIVYPIEYFGNLGISNQLELTFTPDVSNPDGMSLTWQVDIRDLASDPTENLIGSYRIAFDGSAELAGGIANVTRLSGGEYDPDTGVLALQVADGDMEIEIGKLGSLDGYLRQIGEDYAPTNVHKNGAAAGRLTSTEIDESGFIKATYDTGIVKTLYQIPLVSVPNVNGLQTGSAQTFSISQTSGSFFLWNAGDGPTGSIQGYAREASTTDIAEELTHMIQTQRAYSSNAKVIQTVDEMLQETTNIKR